MSVPASAAFAFQTTSTAGTFNAFTLSALGVADGLFLYGTFAQRVPDGSLVYYIRSQAVDATHTAIWEAAWGTYNLSANTVTPVTGKESSSAPVGASFIPIAWGSGSSNVWSVPPAFSEVTAENLVAMLTAQAAAVRTALGLGSAALLTAGVAVGNVPPLAAVGSGAVPDLAMLSSFYSGARLQLSTGGANNHVCRFASYAAGVLTVTEANGITVSFTPDTPALLSALWCRGSDGVLYPPRSIVPFTGVTASTVYYLGNAGALTSTAAASSSFNTSVRLGHGLASAVLWFDPQPPIVANGGGGLTLKFESNYLTA
jgi:hypothetical protein